MKAATPFPIENLPYGVVSTSNDPTPHSRYKYPAKIAMVEVDISFSQPALNVFASTPQSTQAEVRARLVQFLEGASEADKEKYFLRLSQVTKHLPMETANFSDFYCSLEHAQNCSKIMSLEVNPNWYYIPSVYNGRTSSLRVSGQPIRRPWGVISGPGRSSPATWSRSKRLDFELEMGVFLAKPLPAGQILDIRHAREHIFGFVILNDWSARDIQGFEMAPLGPFHSKGFGTTISPWIVTIDALSPVECPVSIPQSPSPLPHLAWKGDSSNATWDIELSARILRKGKTYHITSTNLKDLYWTPYQQLTHLASAGEGLSTGDIFGTGTISNDNSRWYQYQGRCEEAIGDAQREIVEDTKVVLGATDERILWDEKESRAVVRKFDMRLLSLFTVINLFSFIDRVNIGNARLLGLEKDLGLSGLRFNIALMCLFVSYCVVELPSNILCKIVGGHIYIPTLVLCFGIITMLTSLVEQKGGLYACRFLLGVFEGVSVILAVVAFMSIPSGPENARFLTESQKQVAAAACAISIVVGYISDRYQNRGWVIFATVPFGIAGMGMLEFLPASMPRAKYGSLYLAAPGIYAFLPLWLAWAVNNAATPTVKAASAGLVFTVGSLGGILAPWVYLPGDAPNYRTGHAIMFAFLFGSWAMCIGMITYIKWENRAREMGKRDSVLEGLGSEEQLELSSRHPAFRYAV
ncbi:hypothetical protein BDV38DRAFT_270083 [Aspergillus pseudotamarii]|uniref:fumarylacetoacetase n=1 Tax=Aspergillus pseudotamarii TaxID=132259 RepID=A0A5N6T0V6_ASPPS|nr:uncharacterized protein BDV38DRAFT_270083 [Aspergillus pseudotamarii]KAE8139234.1 hypothetical protein BDV38DRAFT_270083 [Aspergillus pseudotamarii]